MEVEKHAYLKKDPEASSRVRTTTSHVKLSRRRPTYLTKLAQLFVVPRIRRAMIAAVVCMVSQQLCGVNVSFPAPPRKGEETPEKENEKEK